MAEIILKNVTLDFPIYGTSSRSLKKKILSLSTGGKIRFSDSSIVTIRALENINLHIEHGDRIGLIGPNGSGKSTLLRLLTGIYEPLIGEIQIDGKITSLLNIHLGLDPESSGNENITLRGILNQLTFHEIAERNQEIADFTGLGEFLSMPSRTYSSGMQLRLAFAVATSIDPEILILDEVVGVGDRNFKKKANERLNKIIQNSKIVIVASHDDSIIRTICNKVIVLHAGKLEFYGDVEEGLRIAESIAARTFQTQHTSEEDKLE